MYNHLFPIPYPDMVLYSIICVICLAISGMIIKRCFRSVVNPYLIPVILVVMSFIISNLYQGGFAALFSLDLNDVGAITDGLVAVGLHQIITKTYLFHKFKKIKRQQAHKKGKRVS